MTLCGVASPPSRSWGAISRLGGHGRRGAGVLRALLEERPVNYVPTHSEFEALVAKIIDQSSLPAPRRQYEVYEGERFIARVDFAYPELKLAIEADSYTWHSGKQEWKRDILRRNDLRVVGWEVYEVIWDRLKARPGVIIRDIGQLLSERSRTFRKSAQKEG